MNLGPGENENRDPGWIVEENVFVATNSAISCDGQLA